MLSLRFSRTKGTLPPLSLSLITLITYQLSFYPLPALVGLGQPVLTYSSRHTLPYLCVGLSTYVIKSFFLFHSTVAPICSFCFLFHQRFFSLPPPPPVSCLSLFTFYSTLHPSWLTSANLLLCLFRFFVSSLCLAELLVSICWCELNWRGECVCQVLPVRVQR